MPCGPSRSPPTLPLMSPPVPEDGSGLRDWLDAQGAFAEALAEFQATRPIARSMAMEDVLEAIQPAMEAGFCYSVQWLTPQASQVRLMHTSGWDLISHVEPNDSPWSALADLMGVNYRSDQNAVVTAPAPAAAAEPAPAPPPAPAPAPLPEPDEFGDADLMGEGVPETPVLPEDREPLSEADRETCLAMIRAITSEQRKRFTIAFRSHFNVDKSSRVIAPHIVQVQHQKFIQSFIDELELVGEVT